MAIRIGHARCTEQGTSGWDNKAKAGDQTGKEVCISNWYNKPWHTILRAKDPMVAQAMAKFCEDGCNNKHIGYDQSQRNTAYKEALRVNYNLSLINTDCETDCSAFMTLCAICGGVSGLEYDPVKGNAPRTANMVQIFNKTGKFDVITGSGITNSDKYLKRGDILVGDGHTVMVLDDSKSSVVTPTPKNIKRPTIKEGSTGVDVVYLKQRLTSMGYGNLSLENDLFTRGVGDAVQYYQLTHNLNPDRIVGDATWKSIG